jgi:hypothetical protein
MDDDEEKLCDVVGAFLHIPFAFFSCLGYVFYSFSGLGFKEGKGLHRASKVTREGYARRWQNRCAFFYAWGFFFSLFTRAAVVCVHLFFDKKQK